MKKSDFNKLVKECIQEIMSDKGNISKNDLTSVLKSYEDRANSLVTYKRYMFIPEGEQASLLFDLIHSDDIINSMDQTKLDTLEKSGRGYNLKLHKFIPIITKFLKDNGLDAEHGFSQQPDKITIHNGTIGKVSVNVYTDSITIQLDIKNVLSIPKETLSKIIDSFISKTIKVGNEIKKVKFPIL